MSGIINVLTLTGSLFMMEVYDRVLASRSIPTLIALAGIAVAAYVFQGWLDILRTRVLTLFGERLDLEIGPKVYAALVELPLRVQRGAQESLQPFRDVEAMRSFLSGPGPAAFFDFPWIPVYLVIAYLLHPDLGLLTTAGALILFALTIANEVRSKMPLKKALEAQSLRNQAADAAQRAPDVVRAMGLMPELLRRWSEAQEAHLKAQRRASFVVGGFAGAAKVFRMILQSSVLGLGAYLAIKNEISSGSIIACSILSSRALAPVDQALAGWKGFVAARQGYARLKKLLALFPYQPERFSLPAPNKKLEVSNLVVSAPGTSNPIVRRVTFALDAGQALGIIGPSASGKSTLGRALVGVWSPSGGKVMLDAASIEQWEPADLGKSVGYLPQDVQLFDGTVAENIARFERDADPNDVITAALDAGFHSHVLALEAGYETRIGQAGAHLSAGQRQRLGLARALYKKPFLVVLDEPNSNLDAEGDAALSKAIAKIRERGGIAIVIAHRPSAIASVDMLLALKGGGAVAFGNRDEVLQKMTKSPTPVRPTAKMATQSA